MASPVVMDLTADSPVAKIRNPSSQTGTASTTAATGTKPCSTPVIVPTWEQTCIYQTCKPPPCKKSKKSSDKHIVRITAGAGSGKTTTILNLACEASLKGHSHITYVTFSRAAAVDGQRRIQETIDKMNQASAAANLNKKPPPPPVIDARTLHSCAMKLLGDHRKEEDDVQEAENRLWDERRLEKFVTETCKDDIDSFLRQANQEIALASPTNKNNAEANRKNLQKQRGKMDAAKRQVIFYVLRTLVMFCRSADTLEQWKDPKYRYRDYYPAKTYHGPGGGGEAAGFPTYVYRTKVGEYANMAMKVWEAATAKDIRTYDLEMKRAQLLKLPIPGTLLLVDESQDLDACQSDWLAKQSSAHIYFVGDAAQTIYSFRGAKSKHMMNVPDAIDCTLTKSWRFGPQIAQIANLVLFTKEKSPQTTGNYQPIWKPYRVVGGGGSGKVTADSLWESGGKCP